MAILKIAGAEPLEITERVKELVNNEKLEKKQIKKMLEQMNQSPDEIEDGSFGFSDFSLETHRENLYNDMTSKKHEYYKNLPDGIFSGVLETTGKEGLILLLKSKILKNEKDKPQLEVLYIDFEGNNITTEIHEIFRFLESHKENNRFVPEAIDRCDETEVNKCVDAINKWFKKNKNSKVRDGIDELLNNPKQKQLELIEETYTSDKWDLICWLIVSNKEKI
jgi:hypothetical protein